MDNPQADEFRQALAEKILEIRLRRNISQQAVADEMRIHRPSVSEIEAGRREVKVFELLELSRILKHDFFADYAKNAPGIDLEFVSRYSFPSVDLRRDTGGWRIYRSIEPWRDPRSGRDTWAGALEAVDAWEKFHNRKITEAGDERFYNSPEGQYPAEPYANPQDPMYMGMWVMESGRIQFRLPGSDEPPERNLQLILILTVAYLEMVHPDFKEVRVELERTNYHPQVMAAVIHRLFRLVSLELWNEIKSVLEQPPRNLPLPDAKERLQKRLGQFFAN